MTPDQNQNLNQSKTKTQVCLTCTRIVEPEHEVCPDDGGELTALAVDPLVGTIFATKYEVLALIGRGGMSSVYKVRHVLLDQIYALKLLHSHYATNAVVLRRFHQEAKTIAQLTDPNIVGLQDFGIDSDGQPFLVMEFINGVSLSDIIAKDGKISVEDLLHIGKQVLSGLSHAHKAGVIHRDLKPGNIMLDGLTPKIVDFGIAKIASEMGEQLTRTGEMFGSPLYMSPEQCNGQSLDARSDVYSLGCVFYECLTGKAPHKGSSAMETLTKHMNNPPAMFERIAPGLVAPWELEDAIFKALEKDPKRRFQTADEFKTVLEAISWTPGSQRAVPSWRRTLKRLFAPKPNPTVMDRLKQIALVVTFYMVVGVISIVAIKPANHAFFQLIDEWEWMYNDHNAHAIIAQASQADAAQKKTLLTQALKFQERAKAKLGDRKDNVWRYYYYHRNMAEIYKRLDDDPKFREHVRELYLVMRELGFNDLDTRPTIPTAQPGTTPKTNTGSTGHGTTSTTTPADTQPAK